MKPIRLVAQEMGLRGILLTGLGCVVLAVLLLALYRLSGEPVGNAPLTDGDTRVIAREGSTAPYDALLFCHDDATKLNPDPTTGKSTTPFYAPDSSGVTYRLVRGTESVEWTQTQDGAIATTASHYWLTPEGQQSEPIDVTPALVKCADGKAR